MKRFISSSSFNWSLVDNFIRQILDRLNPWPVLETVVWFSAMEHHEVTKGEAHSRSPGLGRFSVSRLSSVCCLMSPDMTQLLAFFIVDLLFQRMYAHIFQSNRFGKRSPRVIAETEVPHKIPLCSLDVLQLSHFMCVAGNVTWHDKTTAKKCCLCRHSEHARWRRWGALPPGAWLWQIPGSTPPVIGGMVFYISHGVTVSWLRMKKAVVHDVSFIGLEWTPHLVWSGGYGMAGNRTRKPWKSIWKTRS